MKGRSKESLSPHQSGSLANVSRWHHAGDSVRRDRGNTPLPELPTRSLSPLPPPVLLPAPAGLRHQAPRASTHPSPPQHSAASACPQTTCTEGTRPTHDATELFIGRREKEKLLFTFTVILGFLCHSLS